ncbi:MAG: hypothetical protein LUB61_01450, partial [Eggerthellaceae bacterium]|nr:hypothetical protein [Eggerthellaceae bacterium]
RTRLKIAPDVLFRIESGRQAPTADQFMAINLTLFKHVWDFNHSDDRLDLFMSHEWGQLDEEGSVPETWQKENLRTDAMIIESDSGRSCVDMFDLPDPDSRVYYGFCEYSVSDKGFIQDTALGGKLDIRIVSEVDGLSLGTIEKKWDTDS